MARRRQTAVLEEKQLGYRQHSIISQCRHGEHAATLCTSGSFLLLLFQPVSELLREGAMQELYFHAGNSSVSRQSWPQVNPCRTCLCPSPTGTVRVLWGGVRGACPHPELSHGDSRAGLCLARALAAVCSGRN